jgi:hypothetical protein
MRLTKTEAGKKAISDRSITLSPRQRSALIIFNGERSLDEVLVMLVGLGFTKADVDHMVSIGLLAEVIPSVVINADTPKKAVETLGSFVELEEAQSRYKHAYPLATKLTAGMGFRGFSLNLAAILNLFNCSQKSKKQLVHRSHWLWKMHFVGVFEASIFD